MCVSGQTLAGLTKDDEVCGFLVPLSGGDGSGGVSDKAGEKRVVS